MSVKRDIAKATIIIVSFSVIGKTLGFVREMIIAARFGTTALTDAYFIGITGPDFIREMLSGGVLAAAFIPVYAGMVRDRSPEDSALFFRTIVSWLCAFLVAAAIAGVVFPGLCIRMVAPELRGDAFGAAASVTRIVFPAIVFMGLASLFSSLLNVHQKFLAPAANQVLLNLGIVAGVLALSGSLGIKSIAFGFLAGAIIQWMVLYPSMMKFWGIGGFSFRMSPEMRDLLHQMAPLFLASFLAVGNDLVSRGLAAGLDAGSVSALNFANRLKETPWLLCAVPLATAVFPFLSRASGPDERRQFGDILTFTLRITAFLAVPLCVILFFFDVPIVTILFQRGFFDASSTALTASAVRAASIGAVFYALSYVLLRAYYSTRTMGILIAVNAGAFVLNAVLGYLLRSPLGVEGIAWARSISDMWIFIALLFLIRRIVPVYDIAGVLRNVGVITGIALMSGWSGKMMSSYVPAMPVGLDLPFRSLISCSIAMGIFVAAGYIFKLHELQEAVRLIKSRFKRPHAAL